MDNTTKKCPMCAEQIPVEATICPYCSTPFEGASESPARRVPPAPPPPPHAASPPARRGNTWIWGVIGGIVLCGLCIAAIAGILLATSSGIIPSLFAVSTPTENESQQGFICSDPLRCVDIPPEASIHIGYMLTVEGPNASLGIDSRNGVEIAIDDVGSKILDHSILFNGVNDECSGEGGQKAASELMADPTIIAIIGTSCSSAARSALPILSPAGFLVVSPSNTAFDLTEPGDSNNWPGYMRTSWNDKSQGTVAAHFAYEILGVRKAATIHNNSLSVVKLEQTFVEEFQRLGGTITAQTTVDPNQTDMSSLLADIAAGRPELIYLSVFQPNGSDIIRQAKQTPGLENIYLMGADYLFSPDVADSAGEAIEGFYVSSVFVSGAAYDAFMQKYEARFGEKPTSLFHAYAYDAFMMINAAIEKVAVVDPDGTIHIPRQALRDAMYATQNFQGITGVLSCTPTGDCANPMIGVYQYHAGEYPPELIWSEQPGR